VIFAVLDVSLDVNLCINCSFLHILIVKLIGMTYTRSVYLYFMQLIHVTTLTIPAVEKGCILKIVTVPHVDFVIYSLTLIHSSVNGDVSGDRFNQLGRQ